MDNWWITGVIIPLIAALIGGGLTMWGVVYTIKSQRKDEEKRRRDAVRPFLYSCPKEPGYQKPIMKMYVFSNPDEPCMGQDMAYFGIIKNTDNGIMILDRVETENNRYYPEADTVVEKNQMFELKVRWIISGNETLKDVRLFVKDIYGNEYQYPASLDENSRCFFSLGKCKEV